MDRFYETREAALKHWVTATQRIITNTYTQIPNDELQDTFECQWQRASTYGHVSIFCSLGDWASNITDILKDESIDKFQFENQKEAPRIYRYFTRLLLVVSEIITDFQDIYIQAEDLKGNKDNYRARMFLSSNDPDLFPIQSLFDFINKVCKHKVKNIHRCNHHLKMYFSDNASATFDLENLIRIDDLNFSSFKEGILMPKLQGVLQVVIECYHKMDEYFTTIGKDGFTRICKANS